MMMVMQTRRLFLALFAFATMLSLSAPARSQAWPQRPVKIIAPNAAGGITDGVTRIVAQRLGEVFGQQFVIENRAGASGAIGAEAAARAPADGYTLFMASLPVIAIVPATLSARYDPVKDFAPISLVSSSPSALVVHASLPVKTLAEFVAYVRARPQALSYSSGGVATYGNLSMVMFLKRAGLDMVHVPYQSGAPAMAAVVGGQVPAHLASLPDALPQAESGHVRLLAVTSEKRARQIPGVPTISESGFPGFKAATWNGLVAPAGTPRDIIDRIAAEVARGAKDPKVIERFVSFGVDPVSSSPEGFAAMIAEEIPLWAEAVKTAGAKVK
jgi:tripartite-type tricarboxylate transporter receptor subunit TctC